MTNVTEKYEVQSDIAAGFARISQKLNGTVIPVADVDRAKQFYEKHWAACSELAHWYAEYRVREQAGTELPQ
jgi:hypothetical protein